MLWNYSDDSTSADWISLSSGKGPLCGSEPKANYSNVYIK